MLYGLLLSIYIFLCLLLVLIILIQKGKSSMGLGSMGGGTQTLFGGSGGQDIFQKATWVLTAVYLLGSLGLSIMKSSQRHSFKYTAQAQAAPKPLTDHTSVIDTSRQVTIPVGNKNQSENPR